MRIVINPGHSRYFDPGALGPTGLREADVVREVAIALVALGGEGVTYEPKRQPCLPGGLSILLAALRRNPPNLLVSLHCDAATHPPCIHQSRIVYRSDDPISDRRGASWRLACTIVERASLYAQTSRTMAAPYQRDGRPFTPGILVNTASQAAVLVELGFITDPHVEAAMRTTWWLSRAATALDSAIRSCITQGVPSGAPGKGT